MTPLPGTLTGHVSDFMHDGQHYYPSTGTVRFRPSVPYVTGTDGTIYRTMHSPVQIGADGTFTANLLATNHPDLSPTNWHYTVELSTPGRPSVSAKVQLDPGVTTRLADVMNRPPDGDPIWTGGGGGDGTPGRDGRGITSITDTDLDGVATVTFTDGTTSNLPLPRGLQGERGMDGQPGRDGADGLNGPPGKDGAPGADGHSPVLAWHGDQISIDGTLGPHLTGPPGDSGDEVQDTGWRMLPLSAPWDGTAFLRRRGNWVSLIFELSGGDSSTPFSLTGFIPKALPQYGRTPFIVVHEATGSSAIALFSNGQLRVPKPQPGFWVFGNLTWLTDDPWPVTLPGTPA